MYGIKKRKILFTESFSMSELCDLMPFFVILNLTRYEHPHQTKIRIRKNADFCLYYSLFIIHHSFFIFEHGFLVKNE